MIQNGSWCAYGDFGARSAENYDPEVDTCEQSKQRIFLEKNH